MSRYTPRASAPPGGVQVAVNDRTGFEDPFLTYGKDGRHHGGNRLSDTGLSPLDIPPGTWQIGCSDGDTTDEALRGRVTVVDPDRNWRATSLGDDCAVKGAFFAVGGQGRTEQAAIADAVRSTGSAARVRLYSDGYWQRPGHTYLILRTKGDFYFGNTDPNEDGSGWHAGLDGTCQPV